VTVQVCDDLGERLTLSTVFVWFGALKLLDVSPVADLVANTLFVLPARVAWSSPASSR